MAALAAWIALRTLSRITQQVQAEQRSVELMRVEYAATHRPRIRVRDAGIDLGEIDISNEGKLCQTRVGFVVSNYGESEAIPVNAQYSIVVGEPLPMVPSYQSEFMSNLNYAPLPAGGHIRITVTGKQYPLLRVMHGTSALMVIGYIEYRGMAGTIHRTAFARLFDGPMRRFVKIQSADYEYEE